jgi:hypothetical protein
VSRVDKLENLNGLLCLPPEALHDISRHARHRGPGEARFGLWVSTRQNSPRRAGPDHALDYGIESCNVSSYMVQTRPGPRLEFLIVTPCIVHRSHGTLTSHCSVYYSLFIMNYGCELSDRYTDLLHVRLHDH